MNCFFLFFYDHNLTRSFVSRLQADVRHAYHTLRNGGLEEKNIIVFMYDDIAYNSENHNMKYGRYGSIFNHPDGKDVYKGVPKVRY